jgi:hypothetical protein
MTSIEIKYLDKPTYYNKIENLKVDQRYWKDVAEYRWDYISIVVEELKKRNLKTVLEIGAYGINLTDVSDNMDLYKDYMDQDNIGNKTFIMDARKIPYLIPDKYYDVVVGLSVLEHLGPNRQEIFKEFMRIAKSVILSFPYKWITTDPNPNEDFNIDESVIGEWTNNYPPTNVIYVESRVVYIFDFK